MAIRAIFCMTRAGDYTTASHARQKGLYEELPGGEDGFWVVMAKPSPRLPASALFQPSLGASRAAQASGFESLPMKKILLAEVGSNISIHQRRSKKEPHAVATRDEKEKRVNIKNH